jgi:hypothetical protein
LRSRQLRESRELRGEALGNSPYASVPSIRGQDAVLPSARPPVPSNQKIRGTGRGTGGVAFKHGIATVPVSWASRM